MHSLQVAVHYEGVGRQLVARLKFAGNQSAAKIMARAMKGLSLPREGLVTHMPATAPHIRQRGFDQAQLLARHICRDPGLRSCTLLARTGQQHQLGSDREQRLTQLTSSLRVIKPERVIGQHIILVDDVITTGSSLRAATTTLLDAGAASVEALVFAQAITVKSERQYKAEL